MYLRRSQRQGQEQPGHRDLPHRAQLGYAKLAGLSATTKVRHLMKSGAVTLVVLGKVVQAVRETPSLSKLVSVHATMTLLVSFASFRERRIPACARFWED
jgi:hypothetical protein